MKITKSVVNKLRITDVVNLDPITVIAENFGPGSGKIIIECYGESWAHYWSHMGERHTLETFFCKASDDYLAGKLVRGKTDEPDWDGMPKRIRKEIITLRRSKELSRDDARDYYDDASELTHEINAYLHSELLSIALGDDWIRHIPECPTREFNYLMKIIPVVKEAFNAE